MRESVNISAAAEAPLPQRLYDRGSSSHAAARGSSVRQGGDGARARALAPSLAPSTLSQRKESRPAARPGASPPRPGPGRPPSPTAHASKSSPNPADGPRRGLPPKTGDGGIIRVGLAGGLLRHGAALCAFDARSTTPSPSSRPLPRCTASTWRYSRRRSAGKACVRPGRPGRPPPRSVPLSAVAPADEVPLSAVAPADEV